MDIENATPHHQIRKERNFPSLDLSETTVDTNNINQPILIIQSPKTPTLSRRLKAISLDSDKAKPEETLTVSRDVASMPCTPKRQFKPKQSLDLEENGYKPMLAPISNLKRFASNTSISGSQTLKTLPEVTTLQDFSENTKPPPEPIKIKAKGLLERRGSNASLTIDLGSNSNISESRAGRLNNTKSASHLNLTTLSSDKCSCSFGTAPSRTGSCRNRCYTFHKKCNCLCNFKCRRKSLSNENLYVPPCAFCSSRLQKDASKNTRSCKGCRRAVYPRQPELETSHVLSEDFKLHLQNVQYLQTAGNILSIADLRSSCEPSRVPKLHQEFWEVPLNLQEKCLVSGSQSKNRYKGVLPNEHSRVHLSDSQNYIHANYIKGPDYSEMAYIATQGPMEHTCEDFWEMVWMSECKCIVMLTNLIEKGKSKCALYFPLGKSSPDDKSYFYLKTTKLQDKFTFDIKNLQTYEEEIITYEELDEVDFGDYKIKYRSKYHMGDCVIRELEISKCNEHRKVLHYWFSNWQDHKMANPEEVLLTALHLLEMSKRLDNNFSFNFDHVTCKISNNIANEVNINSISNNPSTTDTKLPKTPVRRAKGVESGVNLPIIAHCSAGIGRTGCFIAILNGIQQINTNLNVDVLAILCSLRLNRGGMVQTAEQYELIHRVLSLYTQMHK